MKDIKNYLKKQKMTDEQIEKFLNTKQKQYFNLTTREFYLMMPKLHKGIVLENLKQMFFGEIMGA
jgi:hypothetical protein